MKILLKIMVIFFLLITSSCIFISKKQGLQNMNTENSLKIILNSDSKIKAIVGTITKFIPLTGGLSNDEVYLINDKFVLKKFKTYNKTALDIQKQAALSHIAPNILYENPKESFVLMDFMGKSFVPRDKHTIKNLAHFLKKLHQIKPMSHMLPMDPFDKVKNALEFLESKNVPKDITNKLINVLSLKNEITSKTAICHNDLNPNNLLFVNDKVIAIDWDAAGLNDPYYDLATIAMWNITIPNIETNLLYEYLGHKPNISELKHLDIMKKVTMAIVGENLIKAGIFMGCINSPKIPSDSLSDFLPKIGKGEIKLDSGEKLYEFGLILLKEI